MAEADERIRREKLEAEQRRLLDEQLRRMQAADAERLVMDVEAKARREAQQRLYWSRATNVLVEAADSLAFDYEARRLLAERSQGLLIDLLTVNPQSSSQEIIDNLRPVIGEIHRASRAFDSALIDWAQKNLGFIKSVSQLEREKLEQEVAEAKLLVASEKSAKQVPGILNQRLDSAKEWIVGNRAGCMRGDSSCLKNYLSPRLRATADSIAAVEERKRLAATRDSLRRMQALESRREAQWTRLLSSLPKYPSYKLLDSSSKVIFTRAIEWVVGEMPLKDSLVYRDIEIRAKSLLRQQIQLCREGVQCVLPLVPDSVASAYKLKQQERRRLAEAERKQKEQAERCLKDLIACKPSEFPEGQEHYFSIRRRDALHPFAHRFPAEYWPAITGPDTVLEWSNRAYGGRLVVARRSSVWQEAQTPSVTISSDFIVGGIKGNPYTAESVEMEFDAETRALVRFRYAHFSRGGALRDQTPFKSCEVATRLGEQWKSNVQSALGRESTIGPVNLVMSPLAPVLLAYLKWPATDIPSLSFSWGTSVNRVEVSDESVKVFGGWQNARGLRGKPDLELSRRKDGELKIEGGVFVRTVNTGWAPLASSREFDRWYMAPEEKCSIQ